MKNKITTVLISVLSVAAGVLGSFLVFQGEDDPFPPEGEVVKGTRVVTTATRGSVKKVKEISLVEKADGKRAVRIVETAQVKPGSGVTMPGLENEDIDEEDLTESQKAVLKELQDALDDNNLRRVRNALKKFVAKADVGGLGGNVPVCMRKRAVEALGWFGKGAAVDLIGFVADSNEEVASDAFLAFEQALSDCEMGDRERSKLVTSMMTTVSDGEQIDSLLNLLTDMRNSVKADAAKEILTTGSDEAKAKLLEEMESYFDEEVKDIDSLEKWKAMNPDDPDDNETYGGAKEE